ncbi:hypothetical protein NVV93_07965 [Pseudomonas sp. LS44]|uniref:hypothetical protein n=1 Tax=Pseudomonas sp. LS44 TaxID=1357074 RepID=UPI00215AF9ED|nr:hypothetical protein [Pseudomonas sp. LS44]UVE19299.1 hypothetical protein NVV93_07965 [Pseudomonas sp. LS44]
MSALGILHTVLSLLPVIVGAYGFCRDGRVIPALRLGNWYLGGMLASVVTSFGLSSSGGFNVGHTLGLVALAAILVARYAERLTWLGNGRPYLEVASMTFSYFVLMIPGLNETLSRVPPGDPIGHGPDSPAVQAALLIALVIFLVGLTYQMLTLRSRRIAAALARQHH